MSGRGVTFGRAVAASAAAHVVLAVGAVLLARWLAAQPAPPRPPAPPIPEVVFSAPEPEGVAGAEPGAKAVPSRPAEEPPPTPTPAPATGTRPDVRPVPATLPPELLARIRAPREAVAPVVDVPNTVTPQHPEPVTPAPAPGGVQLAGGAGGRVDPLANGKPVHGPMPAGQAIVYVLDGSGSMGEGGKFDRARAAVAATLRGQPAGTRFQVVVYDSSARLPLPAPGGWLTASPESVDRVTAALAALPDPAGRSHHAEGVRSALLLRPDVVLVFTDADDLTAARLRGVLAAATRPVTVCVARVSAAGVGTPARLP